MVFQKRNLLQLSEFGDTVRSEFKTEPTRRTEMSDGKKKSTPYATVPEVVELMNARAKIEPKDGYITVKRADKDVQVKLSNKVISDARAIVDKLIRPHSLKVAEEIKKTYEKLEVASGKAGRTKSNHFGSESFIRSVYKSGNVVIPSVPSVFGGIKEVFVTKQGTGLNALIIIGPTSDSIKGFNPPKK